MKPQVKLVGEAVNILSILGRCKKAAQQAGWGMGEIREFTDKIRGCENYNQVFQAVMQNFKVN